MINSCVFGVPPAPVYKGARGRRCGQARGAPGGVLLPPGVGLPPFPCWTRTWGEGEREGKGKGGAAPSLSNSDLGGGARGCPLASSPLPPLGPLRPIKLPGVPVTSRCSGKMPISPGTLPMSKHRLPIYQSSCLDHFETPRHVRDHIRDSEQPLVHQKI